MKYQSQKVAMLYFYGALGLFVAQVLFKQSNTLIMRK